VQHYEISNLIKGDLIPLVHTDGGSSLLNVEFVETDEDGLTTVHGFDIWMNRHISLPALHFSCMVEVFSV